MSHAQDEIVEKIRVPVRFDDGVSRTYEIDVPLWIRTHQEDVRETSERIHEFLEDKYEIDFNRVQNKSTLGRKLFGVKRFDNWKERLWGGFHRSWLNGWWLLRSQFQRRRKIR